MSPRTPSSVRFVLGILLLGIFLGQIPSESKVPPDHSLDLDGYARLGMPAIDHDWSAEERRSALAVLQEIARDDATRLPRFESKRSGELFQKLLYEEYEGRTRLDQEPSLTAEEMRALGPEKLAARLQQGSLLGVYTVFFDREVVAYSARTLASLRTQIARFDARPATEDDPPNLDRARRMASGSLLKALSILLGFTITPHFTPEARADATAQLIEQVPLAAPFLSSTECQSLARLLREASAKKEADGRLRDIAVPCTP